MRISGYSLNFCPLLSPRVSKMCGFYTKSHSNHTRHSVSIVSIVPNLSSFIQIVLPKETTSIVPNLLCACKPSSCLISLSNCTSFLLFFSHFPSLLNHTGSISSILNVSFISCLVCLFRSASASSGSQHSSRTW